MSNVIIGLNFDDVELHYRKYKKASKLDTLDLMKAGSIKKLNGYNLAKAEHAAAVTAINTAFSRRKDEISFKSGDLVTGISNAVNQLRSKGLSPEDQLAAALQALA